MKDCLGKNKRQEPGRVGGKEEKGNWCITVDLQKGHGKKKAKL